jgi:hypothetical protein
MPERRLRISDRVAARIIGGEAVIIGLDDNTMNVLNDVGTFIWERVDKGRTIREIVAEMCDEYEVDEETACSDVNRFVQEMVDKKLLREEE